MMRCDSLTLLCDTAPCLFCSSVAAMCFRTFVLSCFLLLRFVRARWLPESSPVIGRVWLPVKRERREQGTVLADLTGGKKRKFPRWRRGATCRLENNRSSFPPVPSGSVPAEEPPKPRPLHNLRSRYTCFGHWGVDYLA